MTVTTANPRLPQRPMPARPGISYFAIAVVCIVAAVLIVVAAFSPQVAAIMYVPFFLVVAWLQPEIALWLMFAEVAFPYNVSGGEVIHMAPAEISLCLAFPIFWLKAITARRPNGGNPIFFPVLAYFAICVLSTLLRWTGGREAIVAFLQMVIYLIIAVKFFSYCVPTNRQMYAGLWGLIIACTFFAIVLCATRTNMVLGVHKNATGTFLSYSVIILAEFWLSATSGRRTRLWLNILLLINFAGLIMSTSRGAWLGTAGGLGVLLVCRRQYGIFLKGLLLMIPVILACWFFVPSEQQDYALDFSSSARNIGGRLATIQTLLKEFRSSPVLGVGIGLRKEIDDTNIVCSTLAETGVVGMAAFVAIHVVFFWMVFQCVRRVPRNHPDLTFLGLGGALVFCLFVHGNFDHYWSRTQLPVWGMAGAAIAVRNGQRRMGAPNQPGPPRLVPPRLVPPRPTPPGQGGAA